MKNLFFVWIIFLVLLFSCGEKPETYNPRAIAFADSLVDRIQINLETISDWINTYNMVKEKGIYIDPFSFKEVPCTSVEDAQKEFNTNIQIDKEFNENFQNQSFKSLETIQDYSSDSKELYQSVVNLQTLYLKTNAVAFMPLLDINDAQNHYLELNKEFKDLVTIIKKYGKLKNLN